MLIGKPENYFIKDEYKHKQGNVTLDEHRNQDYWHDSKIPLSRFYQRAVYSLAAKLIKEKSLTSVIDVGCGPAHKLMEVIYPVCATVAGIDQPSAVAYARKTFNKDFFYADDFEKPVYPIKKKFDLILCVDVIEHMDKPDALIEYLLQYAHEKSLIIISTPERDILRGKDNLESPNPGHVREWNQEEFQAYAESRGLALVQMQLLPSVSFNPSRWYMRERVSSFGRGNHTMCALLQPINKAFL